MGSSRYLTVCLASDRKAITQACISLLGWQSEFSVPLSANGEKPATHYLGSGIYWLTNEVAQTAGDMSTGALDGTLRPITKQLLEAFIASQGFTVNWLEIPGGDNWEVFLLDQLSLMPIRMEEVYL